MKAILNKLYGKKKSVKTDLRKVELNKIDEVTEVFDMAGYNVGEYFDDQFYSGRERIIHARDIMRMELNDFYTKQAELQDIKDQLDEMGIPYPDQIQNLINIEESIVDKINENHAEFENLGINPMFDRR
jgi:hypothetical protein